MKWPRAADAYSLASIGVNFTIAEAVDDVQTVYAAIWRP
jgi:hypothetical protein